MKTLVDFEVRFEAVDAVSAGLMQSAPVVEKHDDLDEAITGVTMAAIEWGDDPGFADAGDPDDPDNPYQKALEKRVVQVLQPDTLSAITPLLRAMHEPGEGSDTCEYQMSGGDSQSVCVPCTPTPCHKANGVIMERCPGTMLHTFIPQVAVGAETAKFKVQVIFTLRLTGA